MVNDYRQMDKILKEERTYLLDIVKKIKKAKCNVLFIQKSILRDAVNDLSLHFLAKVNIMAIKDIERDEVEFICKVNLPFISQLSLLICVVYRLQANRQHRLFYRGQARRRRINRGATVLRLTHCQSHRHLAQVRRLDGQHRSPRR